MELNLVSIATHSQEIFYNLRWGSAGIACPKCGSTHIYNPESGQLHICADCDNRFSDTSGTIFHSTKIPLSKWLVAIYMFVTQSRGISSYNLSRLIEVSQPTAWLMLTKLRLSIKHDLPNTDIAIIDEIYLGSEWGKKPFKSKLKHIPPIPTDLDEWSKKRFIKHNIMKAASEDKLPVLGISSYNERFLTLFTNTLPITRTLVKSQINRHFKHVKHWISDDSKLYRWMDTNDSLKHSICNHTKHIYISEDGYSSNRLEGVFSHLRRMIRGIYQLFSDKYANGYLNEFAWRWSFFDESTEDKVNRLFEFIEGRVVMQ